MSNLVVGGSGFIGRHLVARLLEMNERVVATSRHARSRFAAPGLEWYDVDLGTFDAWPRMLEGISTVYHLGWSTTPSTADQDPAADVSENVVGSIRLLDALRDQPARLVFASSGGAVYGRAERLPVTEDSPTVPHGAHGLSKLTVENHMRLCADTSGLEVAILRIGNAFGPGQQAHPGFGVIANYCRRAASGQPVVIFGDGSMVRDYVYVDDVVDALTRAAQSPLPHRTFNIGTGTGHSLIDVVGTIERVIGRPVQVEFQPLRPFDIPKSVLDASRAATHLGWRARVSFREGIGRTLEALTREVEQL